MIVKFWLVALFVFCTHSVFATGISYTFNVGQEFIDVTLNFTGNDSGNTRLVFPTALQSENCDRVRVYIDRKEIASLDYNKSIRLSHKPSANIEVSYRVRNSCDEFDNVGIALFSNSFFFLTKYVLLAPEISPSKRNNIVFEFLPQPAHLTSNLTHMGEISDNENLENLFFAGGNISVNKAKQTEILFINKVDMKQSQMRSYVTKIQKLHNSFFGNKKTEHKSYFIFLTDKRYDDNIHGIHIDNNVQVITLGKKVKLDYTLKRIIAHEHLHKWFTPYKFGEQYGIQGANCWFIEGFTDYYTDYLNYQNGLLSLDEYLIIYNRILEDYYTSPLAGATNSQIGKNPYDTALFPIAYWRGTIIAHELNNEIEHLTKNKLNLDHYIKYLMNLPDKHINLSPYIVGNTLKQFTKQDFSKFIEPNLIHNHLSVNAKSILNGKAILTSKKSMKIKYDFDFLQSQLEWRILGVKQKSTAFKVGLRNGQKILGIITSDTVTAFEIMDHNILKTIKLPNQYEEIIVPEYKVYTK